MDLEDLVTGREKRQALAVRNRTLYVSLEGIERLSSYKITTSFGNTICKLSIDFNIDSNEVKLGVSV